MIIRQTLNFVVHLAGGVLLGMLAVAAASRLCAPREEPLEPRYPPAGSEPKAPLAGSEPEAPPPAAA